MPHLDPYNRVIEVRQLRGQSYDLFKGAMASLVFG